MEFLKTDNNTNEVMNTVVDFNELPIELQQYLRVAIYNGTDCYRYEGKCDWDNLEGERVGIQCYKDYYNSLALYYPNVVGGYSSIGIGTYYNDGVTKELLTELKPFRNCMYDMDTVTEQFDKIFPDRRIIHDYDYEQLMDAIAYGDSDLVDSIVGDRDLAELI